MPNPMTCPQDITKFNKYIQRQRLYQFLTGINDNLDKERRDILNSEPLPMVETAYASIRREITRRNIMNGVSSPGTRPSEIGSGLATRNKPFQRSREEDDRRKLRCTHCGGFRHTKEGCFKLVGYPEWWDDLQKRRAATKAPANRTGGKANLSTADQPTSCLKNCLLIPSLSHKLLSVSQLTKDLNCTVLLTSKNCVVQDAQRGRSLGMVLNEVDYTMSIR